MRGWPAAALGGAYTWAGLRGDQGRRRARPGGRAGGGRQDRRSSSLNLEGSVGIEVPGPGQEALLRAASRVLPSRGGGGGSGCGVPVDKRVLWTRQTEGGLGDSEQRAPVTPWRRSR
jgi:hypothetical protein